MRTNKLNYFSLLFVLLFCTFFFGFTDCGGSDQDICTSDSDCKSCEYCDNGTCRPDKTALNACGTCGSAPVEICGDKIDNDCDGQTDEYCPPLCGNAVLDSGETCDTKIAAGQKGSCPVSCDDQDSCTQDALLKSGTCVAVCSKTAITGCKAGDGCCPSGCTSATDGDCISLKPWAVSGGGAGGSVFGQDVALDKSGNTYVTGHYIGTVSFGSNTLTTEHSNLNKMFVAKFSPAGQALWATTITMSGDKLYLQSSYGTSIAADASGSAYVTGYFHGNAAFGSTSLSSTASNSYFVAKLSSSGSYLWAVTNNNTSGDSGGYAIALDGGGNPHVLGAFNYTATFGSTSLVDQNNTGHDVFTTKLTPSGTFLWATAGGGHLSGSSIGVDSKGNTYITGAFNYTAQFGTTYLAVQDTKSTDFDIYLAKLSSTGAYLWAKAASGPSIDESHGLALDAQDNVYLTGAFAQKISFDQIALSGNTVPYPYFDIFVAKYSSDGKALWAGSAGGSVAADKGESIAVDNKGNVFVSGYTSGAVSFGTKKLTADHTVFVAKYSSAGAVLSVTTGGGKSQSYGNGIALDGYGNAYITGMYSGTGLFGSTTLTAKGAIDFFLWKLTTPWGS